MKKQEFDLIVLGGGSGGLVAVKLAKGLGKKVALVERYKIGGDCTWTGCVPSKTLIKSAQVAGYIQHLQKFGLSFSQQQSLTTDNVMPHVQNTIQKIYQTHTPEKLEEEGIKVILGTPRFHDAHRLVIDEHELIAKKFILATGSSPFVPPIQGLDRVNYVTSSTLFNIKTIPKTMVIIGGGPIGIEMACAFNKLGTVVTVVEMAPSILSKEDNELSELLTDKMKKDGITLHLSTQVTNVSQANTLITVVAQHNNQPVTLTTQALLVAVGRKPNTHELNLDQAGVEITKRNVVVDNTLRTTAKNIYACGDIVGPYQFSHMADYQAVIATRNALIPFFKRKVDYSYALWVTFSDPELARMGLTEAQAREKYGSKIRIYRTNYTSIDRAIIDGNDVGLAKIICDKRGNIIGAHILGSRAGEIIHELGICKRYGMKLSALNNIIHAYPTYGDVIKKIARKAYIDQIQQNMLVKLFKKIVR